MMHVLLNLAGLALGLCVIVGIVYVGLRALAWPLLAWARWRLHRQVLAYDATWQHELAKANATDPRAIHGRFPPAY